MLRRNTRSNKPRLPPPPASHTRPGKWEEQIRIALVAMAAGATGEEKSSPSSSAPAAAGASAAAATTTAAEATGAAGEKEKNTSSSPPPPLPPLPPHPSPRFAPALDPDETAAKGTLLMQPMHPAQRLIDARERRKGRRRGMRRAFDKAKREEDEALAALLAAAQQNQQQQQQQQQQQRRGGGGPAPATRGRQQQVEKRVMLNLERKHSEAVKKREEAAESFQAALERRKQRLRARGKALEAERRDESDDDSPGDFSDFEEHRWEREGMALVGGRCWVDPEVGMLYFEGAREEADEEKAGSVTRWFKLKNTLIVPRSSPEFPGGGGGGGLDEEESNDGNSNALELVEMPSSQLSAAPDPERASRDLRAALARREAVEERKRGFSDRMKGAEVEKTFDLRVCVQQLSGEDLAKHLLRQPVPPPESPPFILPPKEEEEEKGKSGGAAGAGGGGGKKAAKAKSQGAGAKQQHSAAPPPPPPGPPVPPITIETIVTRDDTDGDVDFVDGINPETGYAVRRFGFHVQRLRARSEAGQPRRLAVSALATPGSHSPGGPFAKMAPRVMQRALLQLDSAEDFEKVVLGLRAAEEVSATRRAMRAALERRRVEGLRAQRRREEARAESMRALSAFLGRHVMRSLEGEGELELPPVRPLVLECARSRARGDDLEYLVQVNPTKLMYSLSPAGRGTLFRAETSGSGSGSGDKFRRAEGRGMNPFDIQLRSDWEGRDELRGRRAVRFPVV